MRQHHSRSGANNIDMNMKGELSKSRWVPPLKGELRLSKSRWVPPPTVVQKTTTIQSNPKSLSSPSNGTRSTIHEDKATERRANLPSTITYPPSGGKDTRPYMKGCETIEDLIFDSSSSFAWRFNTQVFGCVLASYPSAFVG